MYGSVCRSVCFLCTTTFAERSLTCSQQVSEVWLGLDTRRNKSPLGFKGVYFEQAILQKAFKLNKSTCVPVFQNTAFTASYFKSISCTGVWKWQDCLKMATSLGEHSYHHFHICWSPISLYLPWITEVCYVTRQVYYILYPWGWQEETMRFRWQLLGSVCVHLEMNENVGTGDEIRSPRLSSPQFIPS